MNYLTLFDSKNNSQKCIYKVALAVCFLFSDNFIASLSTDSFLTQSIRAQNLHAATNVIGLIKLQIPAGQANPAPPIGPALGQRGLNIMEFCKAFNAQTQGVAPGTPIPVEITAYTDRSYTFVLKPPSIPNLIRKIVIEKPAEHSKQNITNADIDGIIQVRNQFGAKTTPDEIRAEAHKLGIDTAD